MIILRIKWDRTIDKNIGILEENADIILRLSNAQIAMIFLTINNCSFECNTNSE